MKLNVHLASIKNHIDTGFSYWVKQLSSIYAFQQDAPSNEQSSKSSFQFLPSFAIVITADISDWLMSAAIDGQSTAKPVLCNLICANSTIRASFSHKHGKDPRLSKYVTSSGLLHALLMSLCLAYHVVSLIATYIFLGEEWKIIQEYSQSLKYISGGV